MKLFLNGGGCGQQTTLALQKFGDTIDRAKPLLYIPIALEWERYPDCYEWIQGELREVKVPSIEMVTSADEIVRKELDDYCAIFIGGGNTFKLLYELKKSGAFDKIKRFIERDGVVFGGSAGARERSSLDKAWNPVCRPTKMRWVFGILEGMMS